MSVYGTPTDLHHVRDGRRGRRKANGGAKAGSRYASEEQFGLSALILEGRAIMTEGEPAAIAALRVLERHTLDHDTLQTLAVKGLAALLNGSETAMRYADFDKDPEDVRRGQWAQQTKHGRKQLQDVLLRVRYEVHGTLKPLIDFTMDDVRAYRATCASYITGWKTRDDAMGVIEAELTKHKKTVVSELPPDSLERIRKAGKGAWA